MGGMFSSYTTLKSSIATALLLKGKQDEFESLKTKNRLIN